MPNAEIILDVLRKELRHEMLKNWRADCCIATVRVVCRVMQHFAITAQPLPVTMYAFNQAYIKAMDNGDGPPSHDDAEFQRWCDTRGAWSIGLCNETSDWGHLVAILPQQRLLIDGSLGQAARPQHGINLPEMLTVRYPQEFLTDRTAMLELKNEVGCRLIYRKSENEKFRKSPDWTEKQRHRATVKKLIAEIERKRIET